MITTPHLFPTDTSFNPPTNIHPAILSLLSQYSQLFNTPLGLPPQRQVDHKITLFSNTQPINVRPYRYPHSQKAEIERQVQELLDSESFAIATVHFLPQLFWSKRKTSHGASVLITKHSILPPSRIAF